MENDGVFHASDTGVLKLIGQDLGDYHIIRLIARGGMGVVYEAEQISLNRKVALKLLPNDLVNEFISPERFQNEAQAVANLQHPNIVQVYQFSEWENTYFFAMEFIEGKTLEELLRIKRNALDEEGKMPLVWSVDIIIQVLKALDYAHNKGIIHRDIKPANVMLDVSGRVFITDFGLAKQINLDKMEAEQVTAGTPEYMSPEQANGEQLDGRSDVYSTGLVMYEMLTGDTPYQGSSPVSIIANRIVKESVRRPTEFNPEIPSEIERIILRSVATQKSQRYQSAQEMSAALEKYRAESQISEIVKSATNKEKARAKAEIEKEKEKAQSVIMEEKIRANLKLSQGKKEIKQVEILKLLKISVKAIIFVSIVYLMLFLVYETNLEEDRIRKEIAQQIIQENRARKAEQLTADRTADLSNTEEIKIPDSLLVNPEIPSESKVSSKQDAGASKYENGLTKKDVDWIQTQFQLGKNYEFVDRKDLAVESYMKIIRKYPDSKYAKYARQNIRSISE